MNRRASSAGSGAAEYVSCPSRGPVVLIRRDAARGIHAEAMAGLNALPRRGAEIGGLLLGSRAAGSVTIESFASVESEHRYGPSYLLSERDIQALARAVSGKYTSLEVVGYYRSHTRPEFAPDSQDIEVIDRLFPNRQALFLLVRPFKSGASEAALYAPGDTGLEALGNASPFPFTETAARPLPSESANPDSQPEFEPGAEQEPNALTGTPEASGETEVTADSHTGSHPPDRYFTPNEAAPVLADWFASAAETQSVPDETTEQPATERNIPIWVWVLLAVGLAGLGALLGYLSVKPI